MIDHLFPLQQAFYASPFVDMHNLMKETLVLLRRLERAYARPSLVKVSPEEIKRLREALAAAHISADSTE